MKYNLRIDVCTLCNLNCPTCSMRLENYANLGGGYLKFDTFKKFIDRDGHLIKRIEISSYGEPFLNPDISKILHYCHDKGIATTCDNGSNFNALDDEKIKAIVDSEMSSISFACDGVRQENYEKYRRRGNVNKVFDTVKKIQEYKKQKGTNLPTLNWQYVIMESSEPDIELAIQKAKELDVPIHFKLDWNPDYVPSDPEKIKKLTGLTALTRTEFKEVTGRSYSESRKCRQLWSFPSVNWNGQLLGCCYNTNPYDINVFEVGLQEALNSAEYKKSKDYLAGRILKDSPVLSENTNVCMMCKIGKAVVDNKQLDPEWIEKQERLIYR